MHRMWKYISIWKVISECNYWSFEQSRDRQLIILHLDTEVPCAGFHSTCLSDLLLDVKSILST